MLPRWTSSPLTRQVTSSPATGSISSGVTTSGPTGVVASQALPWNHCSGAALPVPHRDVVGDGVPGDGRLRPGLGPRRGARRPTTTASSASQSTLDAAGSQIVVGRPDQGVGVLREQGGVGRQRTAHLGDVVGVVESAADDLAGPGSGEPAGAWAAIDPALRPPCGPRQYGGSDSGEVGRGEVPRHPSPRAPRRTSSRPVSPPWRASSSLPPNDI